MDGTGTDEVRAEARLDVLGMLRGQILALQIPGTEGERIDEATRLVEDLGLDSLKFVDLTVGIEDELGLDEFPMQDWVDDELAHDRALTVGALADACRAALARRSGH